MKKENIKCVWHAKNCDENLQSWCYDWALDELEENGEIKPSGTTILKMGEDKNSFILFIDISHSSSRNYIPVAIFRRFL